MYTNTQRPQHYEGNMQARRHHLKEKPPTTTVQGSSIQTWTFLPEHNVNRLQVDLTTPQGRPMEALVELWQGPTNVPQKLRVYSENGRTCPFSTLVELPADYNTLAVKNIGNLQFPLGAIVVDADTVRPNFDNPLFSGRAINGPNRFVPIPGGNAMRTFNFDRNVVSLQVVLQSDGGPMSARIELTQGPSNTKQFMDVYSQDGLTYPVSLVIETPGFGKVIRILNTADVAFPLKAWVEPCTKSSNEQKVEVVMPSKHTTSRLPEDLGANGHDPTDKRHAMDIEFQKVVMNDVDPARKFSRQYGKRRNDNDDNNDHHQKIMNNDPPAHKFSKLFGGSAAKRRNDGSSSSASSGVLPYFWAQQQSNQNDDGGGSGGGKEDDNRHHHQQSPPPPKHNGLHP
mmetsp:Transcript_34693/g.84129  ORF Transcript_34693/g.84129 Transcript_34693/m.84129 type:complete len:398 (+) Transcript_34693:128-1321(+)